MPKEYRCYDFSTERHQFRGGLIGEHTGIHVWVFCGGSLPPLAFYIAADSRNSGGLGVKGIKNIARHKDSGQGTEWCWFPM